MKNFLRLLFGVGIVGALCYYFPVLDIGMQLLWMLIPLAVVFGLFMTLGASLGLVEDTGVAQWVEAWVYAKQAAYAEWRESLASELQDEETVAD